MKRVLWLAVPVLIYELTSLIVGSTWMTVLLWQARRGSAGMEYGRMAQALEQYNRDLLTITAVSAALAIPVLYALYKKQQTRYGEPSYTRYWHIRAYSFLVLLGVGACILGNNLVSLMRIDQLSAGYREVEQILYQGPSMAVQVLGTGLLIPIAEELIFRGIIFKSLRRDFSFVSSALVSSLVFGLYHGNLVQFVYAAMLGFLFCYTMETYRTLAAPVIAHSVANLTSLFLTNIILEKGYTQGPAVMGLVTVCSLAFVTVSLRFIKKEILPMAETEEDN